MSALDHLKHIYQNESLLKLFRGAGLRAAYVASVMSICSTFAMFLMEPIERSREVEKMLENARKRDD
jgi:hypothetical protein